MARDDISFLNRLRHLIQTHPIIDHHAHNILCRKRASDYAKYPFESITSEARGAALDNVHKTLPHRRAVKQLAELFGCPADADWEDIRAARDAWVQRDYDGLVKRRWLSTAVFSGTVATVIVTWPRVLETLV